jgi:exopolysaccharide production protein ExoQ
VSQVALLIFVAGIIYALREDVRESRGVSRALWVPLIWLAFAASKSLSRWLNPRGTGQEASPMDYVKGSPVDRNFFTALIVIGLIILYTRRHKFTVPFRDNRWVYLFYIFALVSIGWADYQGVSIKRWIRLVGDLIMALIVLTEDDPDEAFERVMRRMAFILIPLSVVLIRWFRYLGIRFDRSGNRWMWTGVATHKNGLGMLSAICAIFLIWRIIKKWPKPHYLDVVVLVPTLVLLYGARSATSNVVFVIGLLIPATLTKIKTNVRKFNIVVVSALLFVIVFDLFISSLADQSVTDLFFAATGRSSTLTDRVPLWQELQRRGREHALLGQGYGNFWVVHMAEIWEMETFQWLPTNGHNGYLDVYLDLGLIGLALLLLLIAQAYGKCLRGLAEGRKTAQLKYIFLIMIIFHNLTETTFGLPTNVLWILFMITASTIRRTAPAAAPAEAAPGPASPGAVEV